MNLMMKCEEASRLASAGLDRDLSFSERMGLRFHLAMCKVCRLLANQIDIIRQVSARVGQATTDESLLNCDSFEESLSSDAKLRLKKAIAANNS